jgi:hypothetical protein
MACTVYGEVSGGLSGSNYDRAGLWQLFSASFGAGPSLGAQKPALGRINGEARLLPACDPAGVRGKIPNLEITSTLYWSGSESIDTLARWRRVGCNGYNTEAWQVPSTGSGEWWERPALN